VIDKTLVSSVLKALGHRSGHPQLLIDLADQLLWADQYTPSTIFFSIAPNGRTSATPSQA
jgi:hypothetical protein